MLFLKYNGYNIVRSSEIVKQLFLEKSVGIIKNSYPQYNDNTLS